MAPAPLHVKGRAYVRSQIRWVRARFHPQNDEFVPHTQHVNSRTCGEEGRGASASARAMAKTSSLFARFGVGVGVGGLGFELEGLGWRVQG